ncbi:hypothetical protein [Sphingosinicella sp. CPCC 101087]|uniref:hypothetical protein n=1 Tax=Sphingosinicella sp. CPCC 101087 TaxID=2497754 RepID=UPI00101BECD7|nr:hypothetical protein [Sphingosinicella sp. CPCC 101087]
MGTIKSGKRFSLMVAAALGLAIVAGSAQAGAQSAPPADAPAPVADAFRDQVERVGVRRCANLFSALGNIVAYGAAHSVQVQADRESPDERGVQGLVGMTYGMPDHQGQAAGIVIAAPVGEGCEGQLVRVAPFQRPCPDVVALLPAGSREAGTLSGVPLYDLGAEQGQGLLVASGESCVVVTVAEGRDIR